MKWGKMKINNKHIGLLTDLHFGKHKEERWEKIYNDLLDWIIKEYSDRDITQILITGDIFDGHFSKTREKGISFKILDFAKKWFNRLSEHFEIFLFSGNHDVTYKDRSDVSICSIFKNNKNITLIEETTSFHYEDMNYRICPWSCDLAGDAQNSKVDGLFCHLDIQSFKMNGHKTADHGYSSKELFKHADKVWSGHYHWYQERDYAKGKNQITYMGTPLQLDWSEADKESYIHVFDLEKNEISEMIENDFSPKHIKVKASEVKEVGDHHLEVIWDVEQTEELQEKISSILEENVHQSVRFNRESLNKKKNLEYNKIVESMDVEVLLEDVVNNIDDIDSIRQKVVDKTKEIYNLVT